MEGIEVALPNGSVIVFPAGTDPAKIKEVARKAAGGPAMSGADAMRARGLSSPDPTAANAAAEGGIQSARDEAFVAENPVKARVQAFNAGLPFVGSYMDEIAGAIGPEGAQDRMRAETEAFARARPGQDMALRIGGGVAGSLPAALAAAPAAAAAAPASLLGRSAAGLGAGLGLGAAEGGVYGYGAGEGDGRGASAAQGAVIGGVAGGVLGAAAPLVSDGVAGVAQALSNRPSAAAAKTMGLSPTSLEAVMMNLGADDAMSGAGAQRIASAGPGAMLADAGESAQNLLDTAIQRSGPGARIAREAIEGRAAQAGQTVRDGLNTLAPKGQIAVKGTPMRELYDAAYSAPIRYDTPAGDRIRELLPRVPKAVIDRANRLIQMDTDAINPRQIMASIDDAGGVTFTEPPNVLQLDYITRALNDVARAGDGQGALGGSTNEGRIFGKLARQIRSAVRETVPEYGKALDTAATEIGARQAQEFGQTAMRSTVTRAEIADEMASMGAAEVAHMRIGLRQGVEEALDNVRRTVTDGNVDARQATQALRDFSSDAAREKLRMIFGEKAAAGFISQLDEAARALELRGAVATNSKTFARTETDRAVKDRLFSGPVARAQEGEPLGATKSIVQALTGRTPAKKAAMEADVYAEIARLLTQPQGGAAVQTMQMLEQIAASRPIAEALAGRAGRATAGAIALPAYHLATRN